MNQLILDSLLIEKFRTFEHLEIPKLGKVNLIVGRNSVGKTCLLEALWLYAHRGNPSVIWEILSRRDEYNETSRVNDFDEAFAAVSYMFYGREDVRLQSERIRIGSLHNHTNILTVGIDYYNVKVNADTGRRTIEAISADDLLDAENSQPRFSIEFNGSQRQSYVINPENRRRLSIQRSLEAIESVFVPTSGIERRQIANLWDGIALTDLEGDVLSALKVIDKDIDRVALVSEGDPTTSRYAIVKTKNSRRPFPLRSLGDGMSRVLGVALSLVNCQNGILMVDEFENGLHYSIQLDLWRLIFKVARQLNVQVFATSHSWDCIEAFQKAAVEDVHQQGMLVRLEKKDGQIIPTLFDERKLSIATREQIEVR